MRMKSRYASVAGVRSKRWTPKPRYAAVIIAVCALTGCEHDVALTNPQTGAREVCQESVHGFNPWSQKMGCVADHVAQGWTRADQR